jgi:hypothetical protein
MDAAMKLVRRRRDERIQIGDNITLVVTGLDRNTCAIGVEASKEIPILILKSGSQSLPPGDSLRPARVR